ncbi:hypothetical protein CYMTET_55907 [Cymbomonas tetramitiformis]|uniref:Uncharacterized protein n=1 Tax=Cymbomonas tetramitiformis TaxID=36881 RepID=A0AAE0BCC9_9CHLO|nr:hypothetical protein CYMTET_55907 [Cymbomonas tetramitiformis]
MNPEELPYSKDETEVLSESAAKARSLLSGEISATAALGWVLEQLRKSGRSEIKRVEQDEADGVGILAANKENSAESKNLSTAIMANKPLAALICTAMLSSVNEAPTDPAIFPWLLCEVFDSESEGPKLLEGLPLCAAQAPSCRSVATRTVLPLRFAELGMTAHRVSRGAREQIAEMYWQGWRAGLAVAHAAMTTLCGCRAAGLGQAHSGDDHSLRLQAAGLGCAPCGV